MQLNVSFGLALLYSVLLQFYSCFTRHGLCLFFSLVLFLIFYSFSLLTFHFFVLFVYLFFFLAFLWLYECNVKHPPLTIIHVECPNEQLAKKKQRRIFASSKRFARIIIMLTIEIVLCMLLEKVSNSWIATV